MANNIELKPLFDESRAARELNLAGRLAQATSGQSFRAVGRETGYHPETVRRYYQGMSSIPADFVSQVAVCFEQSGHSLLTGFCNVPNSQELRLVTTDRLINELGRRMLMIEDSAVGSVLLRNQFEV